jgi:hypothetical protein
MEGDSSSGLAAALLSKGLGISQPFHLPETFILQIKDKTVCLTGPKARKLLITC